MRPIPISMATQHPDNAAAPYWSKEGAFVDARSEVEEAFRSYSELGCTEYMWDWEGKHVDEAVVERLLEKHSDYFSKKQLGKDLFLTFRVPNPWEESGYKLARAFVNVIAASEIADQCKVHAPPVFEAILPMTQSGKQLYWMRHKYHSLAKALSTVELHASKKGLTQPMDIQWIPLVETTEAITTASKIFTDYLRLSKADRGLPKINYLRPFIARSDPALNSGFVPAVLSAKYCLSECEKFTRAQGIPTYPIIGVGCLPFRGALSPNTIDEFCNEYSGVRTVTIQSAYRYDYPKAKVRSSLGRLKVKLKGKAPKYSAKEGAVLKKLISIFAANYQKTIPAIASNINRVAQFVPSRRERRLHTGLFGYSRKVGKASLPRAITFTCSLYSMGIPPEIIGTGRGILQARESGLMEDLESFFPTLKSQLQRAGHYLNIENLQVLCSKGNPAAFKPIMADVVVINDYLGKPMEPVDDEQFLHRNLTSNIRVLLSKGSPAVKEEITRAAVLRHSIG